VDPFSASLVVGLLARYGSHLAGLAVEIADDGTKKGLAAVWDCVTRRFRGDAAATGALDRMAAEPQNTRRQGAVEDYLDEALRTDPGFAAELRRAVEALPAANLTAQVENSGAVVVGGSLTISGGQHAAGRDVVTGPAVTEP
jgi:hypothetical protein